MGKTSWGGFLLIMVLAVGILIVRWRLAPRSASNAEANEQIVHMKQRIVGKKLHAIQTILDDSLHTEEGSFVAFVFSHFDCMTCVVESIALAQQIDAQAGCRRVYLIGSQANYEMLRQETGYAHHMFDDQANLIREELKFFYTPVFLLLNEALIVQDIFYPWRGDDARFREEFLDKISA